MVRPPSFDSNGMKKGAWSEEEDNKLRAYVTRYGHWNWRLLPKYAGLSRCGKSCRLRWVNYLKPGVKRGSFTKEEADLVIKLHAQLGNKWSAIAAKLPGRTDNEIKNFYHTRIEKRHTRNPAPNKAIRQTSEASPNDQVMEREKSFEITICETTDQNESDSSDIHDATSLINPQQSKPSSFDTNNASLLPIEQSQVDLWADKFLEGTNYSQNQSFPPLIEEAEFYYPQLQYSELSTSDSSYMSGLDWINAEDDHSIISSEYVGPSVHGSFWGESSASNSSSNSQSSYAPAHEEVGGFYDPLIHYFDYGMNLFS